MKMGRFLLLILLLAVAGCVNRIPRGVQESRAAYREILSSGDAGLLPADTAALYDALLAAEKLFRQGKDREAEAAFQQALAGAEELKHKIAAEKARLAEEARLKAEAERRERERLLAEAEERRLEAEREREEVRKKAEKAKQQKEKILAATHTVRKGETLPQIAAYPDVYNDSTLWPLLYRANRDQIKDPKNIWPGQVLRIPRNLSRDEMTEARKYAVERPLN